MAMEPVGKSAWRYLKINEKVPLLKFRILRMAWTEEYIRVPSRIVHQEGIGGFFNSRSSLSGCGTRNVSGIRTHNPAMESMSGYWGA